MPVEFPWRVTIVVEIQEVDVGNYSFWVRSGEDVIDCLLETRLK